MGALARLGVTAGVIIGTAVFVAIVAAVVDLYLTGHGLASISREVISEPSWGVHLSVADIALLAFSALAGALTWWLLPRSNHGT